MTTQPEVAHGWVPTDSFAGRLLLARRELGLTVREAAEKCGVHYATWSTWERGSRPVDMGQKVQAISDGLGVDRTWLMFGGPLSQPMGLRAVREAAANAATAATEVTTAPETAEDVRRQGLEPRTRCVEAPQGGDELAARRAAAAQAPPRERRRRTKRGVRRLPILSGPNGVRLPA